MAVLILGRFPDTHHIGIRPARSEDGVALAARPLVDAAQHREEIEPAHAVLVSERTPT
jgi:hypothetical protein